MADSFAALTEFVAASWSCVPGARGVAPPWQALPGDAGARRYFRLPGALAVWAPPASEDSERFALVAQTLVVGGVAAPRIYAADLGRGLLLIEDLGTESFADALARGEGRDELYRRALDTLLTLQQIPPPAALPPYDRARLRAEMQLLPEWFCRRLLDFEPPAELLADSFTALEDCALAQPAVLVHRDYHCRNLLFRGERPLGVIDFQDAVVGPWSYDLVSLLRDCYVQLPPDFIEQHLRRYLDAAIETGVLPVLPDAPERDLDWMGLQRHIKVLGIFARLWLRDGKPRYLDDLPLVLAYVRQVAGRYRELQDFAQWIEGEVVPRAARQPWYREIQL